MRLAAIMLLFKERAFVEASIRAIYPVVDAIVCPTRHDRNFAGKELAPDDTLDVVLKIPDPDNKIKIVIDRGLTQVRHGDNSEARLRNTAMDLEPKADYYLIVDSDEVWPVDTLRQCWQHVQATKWAGYRVSSWTYFKTWNYRIVEPAPGYRPLAFLRRGFYFLHDRQVNWRGSARWAEYLRKGRKPKTAQLPSEWRLHHGSCVGDDERILTKLRNYGHASGIDPTWYDRVWKNFDPGITNLHYFPKSKHLYERLITIPTPELPGEITRCEWPEGWIER